MKYKFYMSLPDREQRGAFSINILLAEKPEDTLSDKQTSLPNSLNKRLGKTSSPRTCTTYYKPTCCMLKEDSESL